MCYNTYIVISNTSHRDSLSLSISYSLSHTIIVAILCGIFSYVFGGPAITVSIIMVYVHSYYINSSYKSVNFVHTHTHTHPILLTDWSLSPVYKRTSCSYIRSASFLRPNHDIDCLKGQYFKIIGRRKFRHFKNFSDGETHK